MMSRSIYWLLSVGTIITLHFLLLVSTTVGWFGDAGDSPTNDEVAHIGAGISYLKETNFKYNYEHPPLFKLLSGFFISLTKPNWSNEAFVSTSDQYEMGYSFLYRFDNYPSTLLYVARLPLMLLSAAFLGFFAYWTKVRFGSISSITLTMLLAFSPDLLGHAKQVNNDTLLMMGTFVYIAALENFVVQKNIFAALLCGFFGAIMMLTKQSGVFFWLISLGYVGWKMISTIRLSHLVVFVLSPWILQLLFYIVLFYFSTNQNLLQQIDLPEWINNSLLVDLYQRQPTWLYQPIGYYVMGWLFRHGLLSSGSQTFLLGQLDEVGNFWYFPVIFLFKSHPALLVILIVLIKWLFKKITIWNFMLIGLFVSYLFSKVTIGSRHLLPIIPILLIVVAPYLKHFKSQFYLLIFVLLSSLFVIANFPNYLGYANIIPLEYRYRYFVDSSLDWGQDLERFRDFAIKIHNKKICLSYFGTAKYNDDLVSVTDFKEDAYARNRCQLYVVSATKYQLEPENFGFLRYFHPMKIVGSSLLVFENPYEK